MLLDLWQLRSKFNFASYNALRFDLIVNLMLELIFKWNLIKRKHVRLALTSPKMSQQISLLVIFHFQHILYFNSWSKAFYFFIFNKSQILYCWSRAFYFFLQHILDFELLVSIPFDLRVWTKLWMISGPEGHHSIKDRKITTLHKRQKNYNNIKTNDDYGYMLPTGQR